MLNFILDNVFGLKAVRAEVHADIQAVINDVDTTIKTGRIFR